MYLHSGCKQKQTYGREGEQLVPSNSPSCATINTLLWHLPSQGTPKSNRVPLHCNAAAPGVNCEAALQKSGKSNEYPNGNYSAQSSFTNFVV